MAFNEFSPEEIAYLTSLPAVSGVSSGRIRYTEEFRVECMRRYENGDSPVRIFRDAGLSPALIGYKRIERCISRWRGSGACVAGGGPETDTAERVAERSMDSPVREMSAQAAPAQAPPAAPEPGIAVGGVTCDGLLYWGGDMRDLIILQQVRRIDELERELDWVRTRYQERTGETLCGEGGVVVGRETGAVRGLDVLVVAN